MQSKPHTDDNIQVDRFADRLLNALANLDRYANGYDKKDDYVSQPAPQTSARPDGGA